MQQHSSTAFSRILSIALFEFSRFVFSRRGLFAILVYAAIWGLMLTQVVAKGANFIRSPQFEDVIQGMLGQAGFAKLAQWPIPELMVYWIVAALSFPAFAMFAAADQICSDKSRGTIRFLLVRAHRHELLIGRFTGQIMVVMAFIALSLFATNVMVLLSDQKAFGEIWSLNLLIFLKLFLLVLPVISFLTLINTYCRSSKQAIIQFISFVAIGAIVFGLLQQYVWQDFRWLFYLLPTADWFAKIQLDTTLSQEYLMPFSQTLLYLVLALLIFRKKGL